MGFDLEMLAEAARNEKIANLLRESDAHARDSMRELLIGERGPLQGTALDEINARIEVMFSVMGGLLLRKMLNPSLDTEQLIKALRPTMQTLLLPFE